ncbi:MAG TPA: ATP-binding protein [Solirubrobacteraceae bacterium]|nr:ATP-binding protein [Solirubrobacteraceae bacterium]
MGLRSRSRSDAAPGAAPRIDAAVARFMVGSVAAIAVIVVGGYLALRSAAIAEAEAETRDRVVAEGRLVETGALTDGVVRGDRAAIRRIDDLVQAQIRGKSVVRVKLWSKTGTILYSDEPALIGAHYALGDEELELFETNGADAEISDLAKPENRFERTQGQLLEAHAIIRTPGGTQLLFEIYQPVSAVNARARALLGALAPPLLGGLVVLVLIQLPLAWAMARRLQRGHSDREALLANAVEASTQERRRIAADLHDGVVQDLAGVAFGLAPLAADAERRGDAPQAVALRSATETLRQGVRKLRTLLVEIHPPNLESAGLRVALSDLLSPLQALGIATSLEVDEPADGGADDDPLVYRVAREAIRNAQAHAQPRSVSVTVTRPSPGATRLVVRDDGRGFAAGERERRGDQGHLGLTLLEGIVAQAAGTIAIQSAPGEGTTVQLDLPAR